MEDSFLIRTLTIDAVTWTPLVPPVDCMAITMRNDATDTRIRTDSANADSEDLILRGVRELPGSSLPRPQVARATYGYRFAKGREEMFLQAADGTPDIKLYFMR